MKAIKECKIYTPKKIANFMIDALNLDFNSNFNILEPAVGTGYIYLLLIEKFLIFSLNRDNEFVINILENNFCAYDIESESLCQLKESLNDLLKKYDRNIYVNWNLKEMDILDLEESTKLYGKFTHVICNPPYISYKKLTNEQKEKIKLNQYETIFKNNYDLYLIFIEEISKYLLKDGKAILIVPFNYLRADYSKKSLDYLINNNKMKIIYEFSDKTLFKKIAPLSCIFEMSYNTDNILVYEMENEKKILKNTFLKKNENDIADNNLVDITKYCYIYGGIAPLNNYVFMIRKKEVISIDNENICFTKNNINYTLPKEYIRDTYAINEKKKVELIYLIFPYLLNKKNVLNNLDLNLHPSLKKYLDDNIKGNYKFYGKTQNLKFYENKKLCFSAIASSFQHTILDRGYIYGGICAVVKKEYKKYEKEIFDFIIEEIPKIAEKVKNESLVYSGGYYNFKTKHLKGIKIKMIEEV